MRILIGCLKFVLGVSLAIAILGISSLYGTRYLMTRLTALPERPIFPEETDNSTPGANNSSSDGGPDGTVSSTRESSNPIVDEPPQLEPGAYRARVIQPIGLIMRQGPDVSTTQLGGIAYNEEVIVLDESTNQRWIKIRLPGTDVEGWVKNGNTESIN